MEAQKPQSIEQIIEILQHGHGSGVGNVLDHLLTILPTGKFIQRAFVIKGGIKSLCTVVAACIGAKDKSSTEKAIQLLAIIAEQSDKKAWFGEVFGSLAWILANDKALSISASKLFRVLSGSAELKTSFLERGVCKGFAHGLVAGGDIPEQICHVLLNILDMHNSENEDTNVVSALFQEEGILDSLLGSLQSGSYKKKALPVRVLFKFIGINQNNKFLTMHFLDTFVLLLWQGEAETKVGVLKIIALFSETEGLNWILLESGLAPLLQGDNSELRSIDGSSEFIDKILNSTTQTTRSATPHAVLTVIELLRKGVHASKEMAMSALLKMILHDNNLVMLNEPASKLVEVILEGKNEVNLIAAYILGHISMANSKYVSLFDIVGNNGITQIISMIRDFAAFPVLQIRAIHALWMLSFNDSCHSCMLQPDYFKAISDLAAACVGAARDDISF